MIEVEKSFEPNKEQLAKILEGVEFLGEVVNHDIYYDYMDFRLAKNKIKFRLRNEVPELKVGISSLVSNEIEDEEEIKNFFGISESIFSFIKKELVEIVNYKNTRQKYRKDGINIDVDNLDFGMNCCDFEIMVSSEEEIPEAEKKINDFAIKCGLSIDQKNIGKRKVYLKKFKPEIYKEIYGEE